MKLNRLLILLAIVVPIVACVICLKTLKKINASEEEALPIVNANEVATPAYSISSGDTKNEEPTVVQGEMAGQTYVSSIGEPLSKIITDARVAVSVANIYKDADENTEVVGKTEKYDTIMAQKYPKGWSRVSNGTVSGWMRTENIAFPDNTTTLTNNTVVGKTGVVNADPYLNMRAKPSTTADKITTIPDKTTITIQDVSNGWYKVTYASSTGWVSAEFVDVK